MSRADSARCRCGALLSRYHAGELCGPCDRAEADRDLFAPKPDPLPVPPGTCRMAGCEGPVTESSIANRAPRWRNLCEEHYDEQRVKQSIAANRLRAQVA